MLPSPSWFRFGKSRQQHQKRCEQQQDRHQEQEVNQELREQSNQEELGQSRHERSRSRGLVRSLASLLHRAVSPMTGSHREHKSARGVWSARKARDQDKVGQAWPKASQSEPDKESKEERQRQTTETESEPKCCLEEANIPGSSKLASKPQAPTSSSAIKPTRARRHPQESQHRDRKQHDASPLICHLTARTSDNLVCAIHREPPYMQEAAPTAPQSEPLVPPIKRASHHRTPGKKSANSGISSRAAAQPDHKLEPQQYANQPLQPSPSSERPQGRAQRTRTSRSQDAELAETIRPADRTGGRAKKSAVAAWPIGKHTLMANCSSFGDSEDISSAHLRSLNIINNNQHHTPFGYSLERPTTSWVRNSTGPHKINLRLSGGFKAKLFAARGFRRRSYDDQEGDNDINIIMQPSDLHDIEKRSKSSRTAATGAAIAELSNSPTTTITDLELAKCLLDHDYNLTVRLFIRKSALNWNFNSFTFDAMCCGRSLTELLLHLFDYYDLYNIFNLDIVNVLKCFRLLEIGYHSSNPYHNSIHAADVTQAMHCFIQENKIRKHMTHLETLCSILAAVCHDLDHPGVNQSFLVATNNPLASLYNNNSVLENHHWRFALCIFKESQLFDHFEEDVMKEMKKQLKHLILATDIARQNEYLKRFKDLTSSREFSMQNIDDRALVLQMALKCADLGNPCRPWLISRVWSNLICDEFYKMGKIERQLGIPLTPICQREKTSIAGIQTDFFRFIVLPLLELWHKFLESPLSHLLMSNFDHNYQRWQRANRIVQQLRRRKSFACLEPVEDAEEEEDGSKVGRVICSLDSRHKKHSYLAIKRASSDYIKSGNGGIELLRNFQLDRIIEKSPSTINHSVTRLDTYRQRSAKTESPPPAQARHSRSVKNDGAKPKKQSTNTENKDDRKSAFKSRCSQPVTSSSSSCSTTPLINYRKALSPIEDGDAYSPDQRQQEHEPHLQQGQPAFCGRGLMIADSAFPSSPQSGGDSSSSGSSSSVSQASSACSSPVIQRSMSSRTSIDKLVGNSLRHLQHISQSQQRTHLPHHPFLGQYYESSGGPKSRQASLAFKRQSIPSSLSHSKSLLGNGRRRESDPGCCTDKYELAAAIVLIQYQNSTLFQRRCSSIPVCVPKRRSSK